LLILIINNFMSKKLYCIYNKYTRKEVKIASYGECLEYYNKQDKLFRLQHKIIHKNEN
jgi:hypothetical protein